MLYPCELGMANVSSVRRITVPTPWEPLTLLRVSFRAHEIVSARRLLRLFAWRRDERFDTGIRGHVLPSVSHVLHPASEDVDGAHDIRVGLVSAGHTGEFGLRGAIVS